LLTFSVSLQQLGWADGRNVRIDTRWATGDANRFRIDAAELVALAPDVILAATTPGVAAVQQATGTVPIVFVLVVDPVSASFVSSLARPGGNTTGLALYEFGTSAKWLEHFHARDDCVEERSPTLEITVFSWPLIKPSGNS